MKTLRLETQFEPQSQGRLFIHSQRAQKYEYSNNIIDSYFIYIYLPHTQQLKKRIISRSDPKTIYINHINQNR